MRRIHRVALLLVFVLVGTGCNNVFPEPTATPVTPTALPASPTVNPVAPLSEGPDVRDPAAGEAGASNPTQAALAAEGQPDQDLPTSTPQATVAQLPIMVSVDDGLVLRGTFYGAAIRPAPGLLLLHDAGEERTVWDALATQLQAGGYSVMVVDLRGHGETGGRVDWAQARRDARAALQLLADMQGVNASRLGVIGAGVGANLGLDACADTVGCAAAVLLSPGVDYAGITAADAIARLGTRPVFIIASENDNNNPADSITLDGLASGDHQLVVLPAAGHGTTMLVQELGLSGIIVQWLISRI